MADEQFPWLDWPQPHNYAPTNMSQGIPRLEENPNSQWRSSFYNSLSNSNVQPSVNTISSANNNSQAQYYPSYQQQEESYVRLEDVLPYPSYRWGPPPAREHQRQATYAESQGSGLPTTSLPQQSPKRPTSRYLPNPMPQTQSGSGEAYAAEDAYSGHDAKRRKLEASVLETASRTVPKVASPVYSQVRTQPVPPTPSSQPEEQPAVQRTSQQTQQRPGSQYVPPTQARPTAQVQHGLSQAQSSASPQTTAQQLSWRTSQFASPQTSSQTLPTAAAPSATHFTAQQPAQPISQPKSQYASPNPPPQALPQTVAPSDTQIRPPPPYIPPSRPSPQMPAQQNSRQSALQPTSQTTSTKQATNPAINAASQPASQTTTKKPTSQSVPPPAKTATPPVPKQQTPPSQPQQPNPQAPQPQPPGPHGIFAAYTFKPEDSTDRTHLKRRSDIKTAYDPQTIARDILIAAGRHPTEACLNHHLLRLRDVFTAVEINSDLATFKWDLVDPGQPSREMLAKVAKHRAPTQLQTIALPAAPVNNSFIPQHPSQRQHNRPPPTLQHQTKFRVQPQVQLRTPQQVPSPVPQRVSQTPNTPNTPNSMEKKRRGRPPGSTNKPKVSAPPVAPPQPTSSHPLHNLDVLKKHLFKNHVSRQITCGWKNCQFTGTLPATELMQHLGDGPAVATSVNRDSSSSPMFLTIPESNQPGNEDSLIFPADYRSIRAFNKVHGNSSQEEKAQEIFRAVQRLKEHIGVGLDPGGCELATPLRNQRMSAEEDVYQVRSVS
ncbi:hypothetical protein BDW74DRAFT_166686 [Aspergillus multicolor]|uniref:putative C2H2 finger domain protein n=1 Tax=Aspergillus multicolor TaxID=41759 RepID=UPI003CCC9405